MLQPLSYSGSRRPSELRQALDRIGYAFLPKYCSGRCTAEVSTLLGNPTALPGGTLVHTLTPRSSTAASLQSYSGAYGMAAFPLHSDLAHWRVPPRYILLRAAADCPGVVTPLLDGRAILDGLGVKTLAKALVQPRRPLFGKQALLRLYEPDLKLMRWDERYILPATACSTATVNLVRHVIAQSNTHPVMLGATADTLLLDNWRVFHGRSAVPDDCRHRRIERVYLTSIS